MIEWGLKILMKNGKRIECVYRGIEMDGNLVINKLFSNRPDNSFIGLDSTEAHHGIYVRMGDITEIDISY